MSFSTHHLANTMITSICVCIIGCAPHHYTVKVLHDVTYEPLERVALEGSSWNTKESSLWPSRTPLNWGATSHERE